MLIATILTALSLQAAPAQAQRVGWVPNPRTANGGWVTDPSHHLAPATVAALNQEIDALERETSSEIAVVVVDSTSGLSPFDFALTLHRVWGVGKSGKDNGIVFLWVPAQREIFVSVGTGLEGVLPDRRTGRIRDEQIFPAFKRGAFDEGVLAGVRTLAAAAREETDPRQGTAQPPQSGTGSKLAALLGGLVAVIGGTFAAIVGTHRYRRRRPRACPKCRAAMTRLDEQADDALLDKGEQAEEGVHSVDYDVWRCPKCAETLKVPYRSWFTSYTACASCKRLTVRSTSRTITSATTTHEGLSHVTLNCKNCGWASEKDVVIPRRTSSSSSGSSSGGGSSFGGGGARGGGAGGSY